MEVCIQKNLINPNLVIWSPIYWSPALRINEVLLYTVSTTTQLKIQKAAIFIFNIMITRQWNLYCFAHLKWLFFLEWLLFLNCLEPEDVDRMLLWNISKYLARNTASYPRRLDSSTESLSEPHLARCALTENMMTRTLFYPSLCSRFQCPNKYFWNHNIKSSHFEYLVWMEHFKTRKRSVHRHKSNRLVQFSYKLIWLHIWVSYIYLSKALGLNGTFRRK